VIRFTSAQGNLITHLDVAVLILSVFCILTYILNRTVSNLLFYTCALGFHIFEIYNFLIPT